MKQKIEIEVDIPDGYEFIGFGQPKVGEYGLDVSDNKPFGPFNKYDISTECQEFENIVILRKKPEYKWPDFIKSGMYLCMNSQGIWRLSENEPTLSLYGWVNSTGNMMRTCNFTMSNPETPSDWTKSLIRKP